MELCVRFDQIPLINLRANKHASLQKPPQKIFHPARLISKLSATVLLQRKSAFGPTSISKPHWSQQTSSKKNKKKKALIQYIDISSKGSISHHTCMAIISLLAAACRIDCWNAAPVLTTSFFLVSGESVDCLEELVLLRAGLDFPSFVLVDPERWVCRMFWLTTRVPALSMSKSLGRREGWWTRCWFNSSNESSSFNMFLKTGFWRRLVSRSKSVWTWEATTFPPSLVETLCCTRSRRARALLASATIKTWLNWQELMLPMRDTQHSLSSPEVTGIPTTF